jgi:transcription antitermination factor NusG
MPSWIVAQTEAQREHVAARYLKLKEFESYLPKILVEIGARARVVPLFPTYLLVRIEEHWWPVRWTIGVLRVLLIDDTKPAVVSDKFVALIRKCEGQDGIVRLPKFTGEVDKLAGESPHKSRSNLTPGEPVMIRGASSFAGRIGIYDGQSGPERVRVLLNMLGRQVPVSLHTSEVRARGN